MCAAHDSHHVVTPIHTLVLTLEYARLSSLGPVAQWLEQHTHNVLVLGSSPSRPTIQNLSVLLALLILTDLYPCRLSAFKQCRKFHSVAEFLKARTRSFPEEIIDRVKDGHIQTQGSERAIQQSVVPRAE